MSRQLPKTNMEYRNLGNSGLKVSAFSYGGYVNTDAKAKENIKNVINEAWESGINFYDTAENYCAGESELVFGQIFKEHDFKRSDLVVSTKFFFSDSARRTPNVWGLSRKHIIEGVEESLKRLQLDYVDIVYAHRPDLSTPVEETVQAFTDLIRSGKAFYWGTSEWSAFEIEHAHHVATKYDLIPPVVEQPQYNLFDRKKVEGEYLPLYRLYNMGTTVYSPLASGILTGKYNHGIPEGSRITGSSSSAKRLQKVFHSEEGKKQIEKTKQLSQIAEDKFNVPVGRLALAFLLLSPNVSSVILGASTVKQLQDNVASIDVLHKLKNEPELIRQIEEILDNKPKGETQIWPTSS